MQKYESWGRYPSAKPETVKPVFWQDEIADLNFSSKSLLPYGFGRSYGDSCLNEGGVLLDTSGLNRFLCFDEINGLLRCEAGVSLAEILEVIVPRGWFLPVTPGTKFVSVGGAIANDIHGKNHHRGGTFGCNVTQFELLRSNGERFICSPTSNLEYFQATIGGLGLTGVILWAEFKLKPIQNAMIDVEEIRFENIEEFFEISAQSDRDFEYTVSWVDCIATGKNLGRGVFMRGNHNQSKYQSKEAVNKKLPGTVPLDAPEFLLNGLTMKAFNTTFYHIHLQKRRIKTVPYDPFFYPLDKVDRWNKLYGKRGFLQYQFVIPSSDNHRAIREILGRISDSGEGSFLAVLKEFGHIKSPGMLSFPRPGVTLALDFAFHGDKTLRLLEDLDGTVRRNAGVVYPAKDARMSAESFQQYYPNWREFEQYIDPKFSSSFWRRVTSPGHIKG
ncbi:MAG: FAD-binding oxidoreductase [Chloroflexi bacterium]|uniref:FAD-binding oxidoreductase n=1 Tax=Candidatus Chlorohelix allophototropha TaxID=3003348 RepID=A0A8T7M8M0_9CHLR|nr:FAD-binding oxidoreductase [Chloroflexota bacterium]WJW68440.1 FAD-binding oxidoreductase [Chloroflexota bacterium L227-S17]